MSPPRTINYRCQRCGCVKPSHPLPSVREMKRGALPLYAMPDGWELGSVVVKLRRDEDDFVLCSECARDVAKGHPLELRPNATR